MKQKTIIGLLAFSCGICYLNMQGQSQRNWEIETKLDGAQEVKRVRASNVSEIPSFQEKEEHSYVSNIKMQKSTTGRDIRFVAAIKVDQDENNKYLYEKYQYGFHVQYGEKDLLYPVQYIYHSIIGNGVRYTGVTSQYEGEKTISDWAGKSGYTHFIALTIKQIPEMEKNTRIQIQPVWNSGEGFASVGKIVQTNYAFMEQSIGSLEKASHRMSIGNKDYAMTAQEGVAILENVSYEKNAEVRFYQDGVEVKVEWANCSTTDLESGTHSFAWNLSTNQIRVLDLDRIHSVDFKKFQSIAAFSSAETSILETGAPKMNFAWDGATIDSTNQKVDFAGSSSDQSVILRTSTQEHASVINGGYAVILSTGEDASLTEETALKDTSAMVYGKVDVSSTANAFRLWGWSTKNETVSGMGKFRVVAYEFNEDYSAYQTIVLHASEKGSLTQDENGWISFQNVKDAANGIIEGAPSDNMFIYEVANAQYDLKGKTVILAVEAMDVANTLGVDGKNLASYFGIKRMGFMCVPPQSFDLEASHQMALGEQYQIEPKNVVGCESGFTYESKEKGIASVDTNGLVQAVGVGNVSIVVTSGDMKKEMTISVNNSSSFLNLTSQEAKDMASFTSTGAFPGAWDFAWSGGVTADKIDADNSKMNQPLVRMYQTSVGTLNNIAPNDIELISGIAGERSDAIQNAVYVKTDISASAGSFRLWGRAPVESPDMLGKMKTRIVVYVPNADYTNYQAYVLPLLTVEGFPQGSVTQDGLTGMVTVASSEPSAFMLFGVPNEIKGATGAFVVMESYSIENANHQQSRCYVRRFGFDA